MGKRTFDLLFAALGLVLVGPVALLIALAIKAADGGPVFFRQTRIGKDGRPFQILKFRSMTVGADSRGPSITRSGDRRVTGVGRLIRRSKLDELPQLWNVLVGDMSFVGPRPEVPHYVEKYTPQQREVLRLKPGITDEASIEFRDEEQLLAKAEDPEAFYVGFCMPRKIEINLAYAKGAGVLQDLGVIGRTIASVWLARRSK